MSRRFLVAPTVALSLLTAWPAGASPTFPAAIRDALDMPCSPECTICHRTDAGGFGTLDKPFGDAMFTDGGLRPGRDDTILPALQALEAAESDVDGDGVPDVEELRNLEDPNDPDGQIECIEEESDDSGSRSGGCRVSARPPGTGLLGFWGSLVMGALLVSRRTRLARRRRSPPLGRCRGRPANRDDARSIDFKVDSQAPAS